MLPKSSTDLLISEASDSANAALAIDIVSNEPWSIETYAEGLMDELFSDIDNILDGRSQRNYYSSKNEYVPVQTMKFTMPDVVLPSTLNHSLQSAAPIKNVQTTTLVVNPPSVRAITTQDQPQTGGISKLIFMGLGLTAATLGMLYLTESGLLTTLTTQLTSPNLPNTQIPSPVSVKTDPQLDLVNYMLEALAVIEQQGATNYKTTVKAGFPPVNLNQTTGLPLPNTQPTETLPLPVAANSRLNPPNVVERIYIPVYQSPVPRYQVPTVPAVPIPPSSSSGVNNLPNKTAQPATKPTTNTTQVNLNPVTVNPQPLKVAPPKLPTIAPPAQEAVNTPPQVYSPTYSAQLEGLLELGNKSVALFKVDGISRRINLGENIGATGWTLVEVSNGEAIIRRNGEVRSIYTGQKL
ncbi:hypothetical protein FJR38_02715 [Anabaena sp. UHCC 0253]|uniref:hypothetical protein n=1 Tax=Anabaena sp. UHCC 0253 TaxID=2590019 RepID=UPI00144613B1|nr:hypothetical protein [Anabaena sp. UHCC 0253]MTJ51667.1 hypothetical protein [Anabaena sp. UHCC 0253]